MNAIRADAAPTVVSNLRLLIDTTEKERSEWILLRVETLKVLAKRYRESSETLSQCLAVTAMSNAQQRKDILELYAMAIDGARRLEFYVRLKETCVLAAIADDAE